ncbi:MAG: DNA polymerase III subunit delta' [Pseudomonadota bacterium]
MRPVDIPAEEAPPEPDKLDAAPHPREAAALYGQEAAEAAFLEAFNTGRLHHGWMLTGPKGIGKATLAWRIARFLLATPPQDDGGLFGAPPPPESLEIDPEHPVARRILARAEPGLFSLTRSAVESTGRMSREIRIDDVRRLRGFFSMSASDGGRRVVIVDAADEMNISAANAILKLLEEPPKDATLLLVTHQPTRLLPTIRSRCRVLPCQPLSPADLGSALTQAGLAPENPDALTALADGSVGAAVRLETEGGPALYAALLALLGTLPRMDRAALGKLSGAMAGTGGQDQLALTLDLLDILLARLARTGLLGAPKPEAAPREAETLRALSPDARAARRWAELAARLTTRARQGAAVNLDPQSLIFDTMLKIETEAA